jgi:hypothetical protein
MIDIHIDELIPSLLARLGSPELVEAILDDLAAGARAEWIRLARSGLGDSRADYIQGIQPVALERGARVIALVGWLPNAIENGIDRYDMRDTLLGPGSRLTKISKDGTRYGSVPFRHGTPGSRGGAGVPMGRPYGPSMGQESAAELGKDIYKAAKGLEASRLFRNKGGTHWGERLPAGMAPRLAPHHKTDIHAGMVRVQHKYKKSTQSQYMTFRTISERNPEGWFHPGIQARNLAGEVETWINRRAPRIVATTVKNLMGGSHD